LGNGIALASGILLGSYVLLVGVNVFCRYVLGFSILFLSDASELLLPSALVLVFPLASLHQSHLSLRFLGRVFRFLETPLDLFGRLALTAFLGAVAWQQFRYTLEAHELNALTVFYSVPLWPVWGFTAVSFLLAGALTLTVRGAPHGGGHD
jgi:TRAP-type C4-dicarboxylate transport system permease small subunit